MSTNSAHSTVRERCSARRAILRRVDIPGRLMRLGWLWELSAGSKEGRDEAVALPMHRFDQRRSVPMIAYCLTDSGKALG